MRTLSYDYRIPSRSCAEVYEAFEAALASHQRGRTLLFNGRKLTSEALLNAVVLAFVELDFASQRAILEREIPRLEAILSGDATTIPTIPTIPTNHPSVGVPVAVRDETAMQERTDKARRPPPKRGPRKKG